MDSDSDEDKYRATQDSEDEEEPRPPSRWTSLSQPPSPDYSASSSEDEDDDGNMAGQQPQPSQWSLPPKPRRRLVHNFIGAPNGKSSEAAHITPVSTPLSVLLLFFAEIVTLLVVETNRYYHQFLDNFEDGPSPQREVTEAEMFLFLALTLQMGHTVHMGHVDNADRMTNNYTASHRTWKWTKKLFFHLSDLAIVNSYILLSSCGGKKISHRDF